MRLGLTRAVCLALVACAPATAVGQERSARTNYILRCGGCHGMDAMGSENGGIPAFPGYVGSFAQLEEGRTYVMHVPGVVGASLSDAEIAEVMNYVMENWGGESLPADFEPFTETEVTERRAIPIGDVVGYRRIVVEKLTALGLPVAGYPWP
jgi:cytochrome c553